MSAKAGSRWAQAEDDAEENDHRKQEKRRRKEEKARKLQEAQSEKREEQNEPPSKKPKQQSTHADADTEDRSVLKLPESGFGACNSIDTYEILNAIEEGSYGKVSRARNKSTGSIVAVKKLKLDNPGEGFPVTGLREIQTLRACSGPNVVDLIEVAVGNSSQE